jgi:hypothetical protein
MGGVKDLGTRSVPALMRNYLSRMARGRSPAVQIERRQLPYWVERGWQRQGNQFNGYYQTPYGSFQGWIEQQASGYINFFLHSPSDEIRGHSHWACFQARNDGWYLVHMGRQPRDVSSGIMTIERLIAEAYET